MENKEYAKECGLRLRRVRMARNMSQQELADKAFTTPQNISKLEKNGISDIDTIKTLSQILGQDLLSDERNEEGVVGEIGRHILKKISENDGFIPVEDLIENHMYGLNEEIVTNEIFKLEKIGMCVREQYKNFYDTEKDMLFITAKGVIALNNLITFGDVVCKTYEEFLDGRNTIQEYYDENKVEKLVRNLHCWGTYRIDYINYLVKKYEQNYIDEKSDICNYHGILSLFKDVLPDWTVENNVLYRMIAGLDNKTMVEYAESLEDYDYEDYIPDELDFDMLDHKYGGYINYFDSELCNISETIEEWCNKIWTQRETEKKERTEDKISEEEKEYLRMKPSIEKALDEYTAFDNGDIDYFIKERNAFVEGKYPSEWFSLEEIKTFIKENFKIAETEEEKHIDKILAEINQLDPSSLDYYNCFYKWKEAGIESMIKSFYNLSTDEEEKL